MPLVMIAACSREGCLGHHRAITLDRAASEKSLDHLANEAAQVAGEHGWTMDGAELVCPPCTAGKGPVTETGDCPRCGGRPVWRRGAEVCMYEGTPIPAPEGWES